MPPANDDRPLYADAWPDLHDHCLASLQRRRDAYPPLVRDGKMDADLARRDIAAWELLAREWEWISTGGRDGAPPPRESLSDRIAAVDLAMQRVDEALSKGDRSHGLLQQSHLVHALQWHLSRRDAFEPAIHATVRLTALCRADAAAAPQAERQAA